MLEKSANLFSYLFIGTVAAFVVAGLFSKPTEVNVVVNGEERREGVTISNNSGRDLVIKRAGDATYEEIKNGDFITLNVMRDSDILVAQAVADEVEND